MHCRSRRGGVLAGVLIGLGVLVVLVVVAMVGLGVFVARHVTVRETRGNTVVETPFGSLRVREGAGADPRLAGLPVYPGAKLTDDRHKRASVELDFGDDSREFSLTVAAYTTPDPVDQVAAFYRQKLGSWKYTRDSRGHIRIESTQDGAKRVVAISGRDGLTNIGLASVGEPASN
jgi:hypothetical protein